MALSRRQLLAGVAAGAAAARPVGASQAEPKKPQPPPARGRPAICLYSQVLVKVPYDELGPILRSIGVDGCDLSVQPGGHVNPLGTADLTFMHMMRSVEAITGVGLEVPVITTAFTSLKDPNIQVVMQGCAQMGVPLFRAGRWKYSPGTEIEARLVEVQRDIAGLAALARAVKMAVAIQNVAGDFVGEAIWDTHMIIRSMDPRLVGYAFDSGYATAEGAAGGWEIALRLALPRLKMVTARDFYWAKDGGAWNMTPCPLGEGMVPWPKILATLANARFTGPISIEVAYDRKDDVSAIQHDVGFMQKLVAVAYA